MTNEQSTTTAQPDEQEGDVAGHVVPEFLGPPITRVPPVPKPVTVPYESPPPAPQPLPGAEQR